MVRRWRLIGHFPKTPWGLKSRRSKADPRQRQDWILKRLQGGCDHPLAACAVATLGCSPPVLATEALVLVAHAALGRHTAMKKSRIVILGFGTS
jgi:hypothetical protein